LMSSARNIVLVGFMGTGKTAVGRTLAARLNLAYLDMDATIEAREGRTISDMFAHEGEARFRALERALVRELAARSGLVIATGGGIVLDPRNVEDFARTGLVVCLRAEPETILARVARDTHRPLLEGGDKLQTIRSILEKRRALYDAVPHQIDTTPLSVDQVADAILALY
ncbi:MAG: shikimate kinase, partial [Lentisphaerae bacterium]|nr:shikimate kinase [Lentisphaerota bacterium]